MKVRLSATPRLLLVGTGIAAMVLAAWALWEMTGGMQIRGGKDAPSERTPIPELALSPLEFASSPRLDVRDGTLAIEWETSAPTDALATWGRTDPLEKVLEKKTGSTDSHRIALSDVAFPWLHVFYVLSRDEHGNTIEKEVRPGNGEPALRELWSGGPGQGQRGRWAGSTGGGGEPVLVFGSADQTSPTLLRFADGRIRDAGQELDPPLPSEGISAVSWADYDNDGHADVMVTAGRRVLVYRQGEEAAFRRVQTLESSLSAPLENVLFVDADADGLNDIITVSEGGEIGFLRNFGPPDYSFRTMEPIITRAENRLANIVAGGKVLAGYLTGDGMMDLFLTAGGGIVLENVGGDFHAIPQEVYPDRGNPTTVSLADYDRDGDDDLCVAFSQPARVLLLRNTGGGVFQRGEDITNPEVTGKSSPTCSTWADLTGDSVPDLVIGHDNGRQRFLFNSGTQLIEATSIYHSPALDGIDSIAELSAGDIDGDGFDDLFVGGKSGRATLLHNRIREQFARFVAGDQ